MFIVKSLEIPTSDEKSYFEFASKNEIFWCFISFYFKLPQKIINLILSNKVLLRENY